MGAGERRCVVGIDGAKQTHVVCALEAPSGALRLKPSQIEASVDGSARLQGWLASWAEPAATVIGMEATGTLWEPLHAHLTQAGYQVLLLNPRQTASWATSLGLRAKTDGIDAHTLARGLRAGRARPSTRPSETVQALRALTRARRDLVQTRAAARQRLQDELVVLFPEFVALLRQLPGDSDLGAPAALHLLEAYPLEAYPSALALAQAPDARRHPAPRRRTGAQWTMGRSRGRPAAAGGSALGRQFAGRRCPQSRGAHLRRTGAPLAHPDRRTGGGHSRAAARRCRQSTTAGHPGHWPTGSSHHPRRSGRRHAVQSGR